MTVYDLLSTIAALGLFLLAYSWGIDRLDAAMKAIHDQLSDTLGLPANPKDTSRLEGKIDGWHARVEVVTRAVKRGRSTYHHLSAVELQAVDTTPPRPAVAPRLSRWGDLTLGERLRVDASVEEAALVAWSDEASRHLAEMRCDVTVEYLQTGVRFTLAPTPPGLAVDASGTPAAVARFARATRALMARWPRPGDPAPALARYADAPNTPPELRERALAQLLGSYPDSEAARALAARLEADGDPRAALLEVWAPASLNPRTDAERRARVLELHAASGESSPLTEAILLELMPWSATHADRLSAQARVEAARRALEDPAAPPPGPERDAALTALLASEPFASEPFVLMRALLIGGWRPSKDTRLALLADSGGALCDILVHQLTQREPTDEDLSFLREVARRHANQDAVELLRRHGVDLQTAGQLTLTEDHASRGGLTQSDVKGGLEEV